MSDYGNGARDAQRLLMPRMDAWISRCEKAEEELQIAAKLKLKNEELWNLLVEGIPMVENGLFQDYDRDFYCSYCGAAYEPCNTAVHKPNCSGVAWIQKAKELTRGEI